MDRKRLLLVAVPVLALSGIAWSLVSARTAPLVLTGIVTTDDVVVSPQVPGQVDSIAVTEGDSVVRGQLIAVIRPDEFRADQAYYAHTADAAAGQLVQGEAALRLQEEQNGAEIRQAEAALAAAEAQLREAEADAGNAKKAFDRAQALTKGGATSEQELDQARTTAMVTQARVAATEKQVEAQRAALAIARSNAQQIVMRRGQLESIRAQQAAAVAQRTKADVKLAWTEVRAPVNGIVDVRAIRAGEYVAPGQAIVSLVDPDALWIRADVEESYIDRVRIGDSLTVRLPSGEERRGVIFFAAWMPGLPRSGT